MDEDRYYRYKEMSKDELIEIIAMREYQIESLMEELSSKYD